MNTKYYGYRYFGNSVKVSDNSWETGLNGNDLIFGTSGSGKTRGYVLPNILRTKGSLITIDSKNQLYGKTKDVLMKKGYRVELIDFENPSASTIGYNPLDFIGHDEDGWSAEDIRTISSLLIKGCEDNSDPFWHLAAQQMIETYMTFVLEALPRDQRTPDEVSRILNGLNATVGIRRVNYIRSGKFKTDDLFYYDNLPESQEELKEAVADGGESAYPLGMFFYEHPESRSAELFTAHIENVVTAEKMYTSIVGIANTALHTVCLPSVKRLTNRKDRIRFSDIAKERTAVFINVSDSDRSKDLIVSLFYNQLFNQLLRFGRTCEDSRLPVPVRIFMDDFASGTKIDHFDKLISVIRSYDISVSVILQSMTQLYSMYGDAEAKTITNNCDHILYLGGQDMDTIGFISEHMNRTSHSVMGLPLDKAILITRGETEARIIPNVYIDLKDALEDDDTLLLCS